MKRRWWGGFIRATGHQSFRPTGPIAVTAITNIKPARNSHLAVNVWRKDADR